VEQALLTHWPAAVQVWPFFFRQALLLAWHAVPGALQSSLAMQPTHADVVPRSRHLGDSPLHAVQLAPQLLSVLQVTHAALAPHCLLLAHCTFVAV